MLSRHVFQDIFHQFGIGNPCPDLRLVIPRVVVAPVIVFTTCFLTEFPDQFIIRFEDSGEDTWDILFVSD